MHCRLKRARPRRRRLRGGRSRVPVTPGTVVSGFMPMRSEINPLPLLRRLADAGAQLALPVVMGRGKPLVMRAYALRP